MHTQVIVIYRATALLSSTTIMFFFFKNASKLDVEDDRFRERGRPKYGFRGVSISLRSWQMLGWGCKFALVYDCGHHSALGYPVRHTETPADFMLVGYLHKSVSLHFGKLTAQTHIAGCCYPLLNLYVSDEV